MLHAMILAVAALVAHVQDVKPADRARANLGSYFSTNDYPAGALRRGAEGTVRFELEIGTDGRVSRCTVSSSSGDADLDTTTCAILSSRATYSPARDADGRAVAGSDRGSVTWRLPDDGGDGSNRPSFEPTQLASTMRRTSGGAVTCSFAHNGQPAQLIGPSQCAIFGGSGAETALRELGVEGELTLTFALQPAGTSPASGVATQGELVFDTRAEIVVARDGSITTCQITQTRVGRRLAGLSGALNLCATYGAVGRPMFQVDPEQGGDVRRGEIRSTLYLRTGSPPRP